MKKEICITHNQNQKGMKLLSSIEIVSDSINIYVPREANFLFLKTTNLEEIKKVLIETDWFPKGLQLVEGNKEVGYNFSQQLYLEPNLKILCWVGNSYPRYFKNQEVHYGCWELYEFGTWNKNINHYYKPDGTLEKIEHL